MNLIDINITEQIDKVKDEIKSCNEDDFDSLINKYNIFKYIKNTLDENLIEIEPFKKILEEDQEVLEEIYEKFQKMDMYIAPPIFDEVMLETFLDEISKDIEELESEDSEEQIN